MREQLRKIKKRIKNKRVEKKYAQSIEDIFEFCCCVNRVHTPENCSAYFKGKYSVEQCRDVINYLFDTRRMGAYCLCDGNPQGIMREWITKHYPEITKESSILEVGPGNFPLFEESEYSNWYACDFNYEDGKINFSGNIWGDGKYTKIVNGTWENLSNVRDKFDKEMLFDLVCGSHSFEHNQTPIKAIREAAKVLKHGGYLICFVPDGLSTWPGNYDKTHTIYMSEPMAKDFFENVEDMELVHYSTFRTNMDVVFVAKKI